MTMIRLLAVGLFLATTPAWSLPRQMDSEVVPGPLPEKARPGDQVAIATSVDDRMTVAVHVGGQGPYRFLVDTGSERTVISRQLAERLKLDSGQVTKLHSVIGVDDVDTVFIPNLKVSSNTISVDDAPALEASNIGADGMLGIDSLRSQRVMFDFKAKTMTITQSNAPQEKLDGDTIIVRARTRRGRLIFTNAKIEGRDVTVVVDTGSQVTIGNNVLARLLARSRMRRSPDPTELISVTGARIPAHITKLKQLKLDGLHINDLSVAFADAYIFKQLGLEDRPALLLGMNAMRAFDRISIDFAAKKIRFVLPGSASRDTLRMAKLERRFDGAAISGW